MCRHLTDWIWTSTSPAFPKRSRRRAYRHTATHRLSESAFAGAAGGGQAGGAAWTHRASAGTSRLSLWRNTKSGMERFALMLDAEGGDRTPDGLAESFGQVLPGGGPPERSRAAWMALANETSQYLSILRPGEDKARAGEAHPLRYLCGDAPRRFLRGVCAWVTRRRNAASAANGS